MKLLVIDDHFLVRDAMRGVIRQLDADATVLDAKDWRSAVAQLEADAEFDLVLLDLGLPDRDGFDALAELRAAYPATSVVVLSGQNDPDSVTRALELGAVGFIPKSESRGILLSALNLVFAGGMYIPPEFIDRRRAATRQRSDRSDGPFQGAQEELGLSPRQRDVLARMMRGMSNKAICRALDLAEPTVKNHVTAILKELNVTNRTEAVIEARSRGFDPAKR